MTVREGTSVSKSVLCSPRAHGKVPCQEPAVALLWPTTPAGSSRREAALSHGNKVTLAHRYNQVRPLLRLRAVTFPDGRDYVASNLNLYWPGSY